MVLSVRHWVRMLGLVQCVDKKSQNYVLTELAERLFVGDSAWDKCIDDIGTVWLLHWLTQSDISALTTARWFFNYFNGIKTDKQQLAKNIEHVLASHDKKVTESTLNKDIDCFFQTYSTRLDANKKMSEDSFTSPFSELGLIRHLEGKLFLSELSKQATLPVEVFAYALIDYIKKKQSDNNEKTVKFETLLSDAGSPGRVFRLSASGLSEKLDAVEKLTNGQIAWTDTLGLRQLQHNYDDLAAVVPAKYLASYYQG